MNMGIKALQQLVGDLFQKRYLQGDPEVEAHHRLATYVLNQRTQSGSALRFHLKEIVY